MFGPYTPFHYSTKCKVAYIELVHSLLLRPLDGQIEHEKQNHGEFWNSRKLLDWVKYDRVRILGTHREKSVCRVGLDLLVRNRAEHANSGQTENGNADGLIQKGKRIKNLSKTIDSGQIDVHFRLVPRHHLSHSISAQKRMQRTCEQNPFACSPHR